MLQSFEPLKPHWIDNKSELDSMDRENKEKMEEIFDKVEYEDKMRDHSINTLTPDEHKEIALFHSYKQDPFFKHHLRTFLSKFAEDTTEK